MNALLTLLERTAQKAQELSASQSVAGTPLQIGDVTVIPISKVSCGFAVGGSDVPAKRKSDASLGGGGTKLTLTPLSFLAVCGTEVQMLHVAPKESSGKGLVALLTPLVRQLQEKQEKKASSGAE